MGTPRMSGHLKSTAGASFQLLQASHVIPRHLPGSENSSDCLTKTLPANKLLYLIRRSFGLEYAGTTGTTGGFSVVRSVNIVRVNNVTVIGVGIEAVHEVHHTVHHPPLSSCSTACEN